MTRLPTLLPNTIFCSSCPSSHRRETSRTPGHLQFCGFLLVSTAVLYLEYPLNSWGSSKKYWHWSPTPDQLNKNPQGWDPGIYKFLKLPRWFWYAVQTEDCCSRWRGYLTIQSFLLFSKDSLLFPLFLSIPPLSAKEVFHNSFGSDSR